MLFHLFKSFAYDPAMDVETFGKFLRVFFGEELGLSLEPFPSAHF